MKIGAIALILVLGLIGVGLFKVSFVASGSHPQEIHNPLFQPLTAAEFKALLPKHKITLINMWASWCGPCKQEFPELMKLRERHQKDGLDVVFLSVDRPSELGDAEAFLKEQNVNFVSYFASEPLESTIQGIAGDWAGALPSSYVFDAAGEKLVSWQGGSNLEGFEAQILPLLAK
jgi:thiol-disulfide isomerase/thioredoxin